MSAAVVPPKEELSAVAHLAGKSIVCRSSVGKSDTGDGCSGGSSIGRVERRDSSDLGTCHAGLVLGSQALMMSADGGQIHIHR